MFGTKRDATRAVVLHKRFMKSLLDKYNTNRIYDLIYKSEIRNKTESLEDGWQFIGMGSFRACYLSPAGIVYKVMHSVKGASNHQEIDRYEEVKNIPNEVPGVRIPQMRLIESRQGWPVVAAEYIEVEPTNCWRCWSRTCYCDFPECIEPFVSMVCAMVGLNDGHDHNVMFDSEGNIVMIDLGE